MRREWFCHAVIAAILVGGTTMLGCGTAPMGSVSPPPTATSPPTTAAVPVTVTAPTTSGDDLTEDYGVYSALIQDRFIDRIGSTLIVIRGSTVEPSTDSAFNLGDCLAAIKYQVPGLGDDILSDFAAKNQTPLLLERRFDLSVDYTLVSEDDAVLGWGPMSTAWDAFSAKYPGSQGSIYVSRIGFNEAKDTALLYVSTYEGDLVLLKKTAGRWAVQNDVLLWEA